MLSQLFKVCLERLHLKASIGKSFLHQGLDRPLLSCGARNLNKLLKKGNHIDSPNLRNHLFENSAHW